MATIVIAEMTEATARQIATGLNRGSHQLRIVRSLDEAMNAAREDKVEGIVFGPSFANESSLAAIGVARRDTGVATVVVASSMSTDFLRQAMRAGVSDVIPLKATPEEMSGSVAAALTSAAGARASERTGSSARQSTVVTVFSTKGGVGKTVLSTNIATALASQHGRSVAVLDLDLQFGDVGIALGLLPERTIFDAAQAFDRLDPVMLQGMLTSHTSGAKVLLAPVHPEDAEAITAGRVSGIVCMLRELFDFVVIDTAPAFNDVTLSALDNSDVVYIVTMMDVASIKNTRITMQKLTQLGYPTELTRLVLNRADSKVFLTVPEVEKAIGGRIAMQIPSDLLVPRSVNKGIPVVLDEPKSKVARSISSVVDDVLNVSRKGGEGDVA